MSDDQDGCEWVNVSSGTGLPGIGGGAYWATARPLFGSCGPPLSLAHSLFWVM